MDELGDQHRLAHAGAAEETDLAALDVRGQQVDDLDAGLEHLVGRLQGVEARRRPMDWPSLYFAQIRTVIDDLAQHVDKAAKRRRAYRHGHRLPRVFDLDATGKPVGAVHGHGAYLVVAQVLLHLGDQHRLLPVVAVHSDLERVVDRRQLVGKVHVDDCADDLDHPSLVHTISSTSVGARRPNGRRMRVWGYRGQRRPGSL